MSPSVAVATDLDSFALVLTVAAGDTDEGVRAAVDRSAAQLPAAVVVDLTARASPGRLPELGRICARYAVPLLVAATLTVPGGHTFPDVARALASLPHAARAGADQRSLSLEPVQSAPAKARAAVDEATTAWGLAQLAFPTELITSELVSNAVQHAASPVDLLLRRTASGLCVSVRDGSPVAPVPATEPPGTGSLRGRGLFLVSSTASRWGYLIGTADKVVWAMVAA
jgi:Histidine kinase-like ATPase domain